MNNSFGKIVLKSYDSNDTSDLSDFNDTASYMNGMGSVADDDFTNMYNDSYNSNELSFLNNNLFSNIDASQVISQRNKYTAATSAMNSANNNNNTYQSARYNSTNGNGNSINGYNDYSSSSSSSVPAAYHRRSNSANQQIGGQQRYYNPLVAATNASSNLARNYSSNESSTASKYNYKAASSSSNYTASYLENKNLGGYQATNSDLPDSYEDVKSSLSNGSRSADEDIDNPKSQDNALSKPFVPGNLFILNNLTKKLDYFFFSKAKYS